MEQALTFQDLNLNKAALQRNYDMISILWSLVQTSEPRSLSDYALSESTLTWPTSSLLAGN